MERAKPELRAASATVLAASARVPRPPLTRRRCQVRRPSEQAGEAHGGVWKSREEKEALHGRGQGSDRVEETGEIKKKGGRGVVMVAAAAGEHSHANPHRHPHPHTPASGDPTLALGRSARNPEHWVVFFLACAVLDRSQSGCIPVMILPQVHLRKPCYDFYFL